MTRNKSFIGKSRATRLSTAVLVVGLLAATPAYAGFWCDVGCYASATISDIGCGLGFVGDSVSCIWNNSTGDISGNYNSTDGLTVDGQVTTDGGGWWDCETNTAAPNFSSCVEDTSQSLDDCTAGCSNE